tara:strand:- start:398 stop:1018 length:621 start_codon:yes stop_codon:yes gene_type:complete
LKTIILVGLLLLKSIFAQECLIDGKSMYSIGSSEIVNGELLALFRCDDGHQMWLSNYDEENAKKNVLEETSTESQSDPVLTSGTVSVLADIIESEDISLQTDYKPVPIPITKKEAVLKIGSAGTNFTSDVSIKKFGVETLLHKKIESDRVFAEAIEEEKNELLYIMNTQKRLFEIAEESNLKFRPFENPIKFSIYTILSVILISSL